MPNTSYSLGQKFQLKLINLKKPSEFSIRIQKILIFYFFNHCHIFETVSIGAIFPLNRINCNDFTKNIFGLGVQNILNINDNPLLLNI